MSIPIRYPNITGKTEREQIVQIKSYLHQLVDQLNYVLPLLEGSTQNGSASEVQDSNNLSASRADT